MNKSIIKYFVYCQLTLTIKMKRVFVTAKYVANGLQKMDLDRLSDYGFFFFCHGLSGYMRKTGRG